MYSNAPLGVGLVDLIHDRNTENIFVLEETSGTKHVVLLFHVLHYSTLTKSLSSRLRA